LKITNNDGIYVKYPNVPINTFPHISNISFLLTISHCYMHLTVNITRIFVVLITYISLTLLNLYSRCCRGVYKSRDGTAQCSNANIIDVKNRFLFTARF